VTFFSRLLLDCGVRVSEACGLRLDQLDLDQGMALVKGKGSKVRPIYFSARTVRALDRYIRMRSRHRWAHLDALFLTQRGALSPDGARDRVKIRGTMAGVDAMHPDRFRNRPRLPDIRWWGTRLEDTAHVVKFLDQAFGDRRHLGLQPGYYCTDCRLAIQTWRKNRCRNNQIHELMTGRARQASDQLTRMITTTQATVSAPDCGSA